MKKLILILTIILLGINVIAQETQQTQEGTDIKGSVVIKKQPTCDNAKQTQKVEKVYGSIVIFVQGKAPFDKTENK